MDDGAFRRVNNGDPGLGGDGVGVDRPDVLHELRGAWQSLDEEDSEETICIVRPDAHVLTDFGDWSDGAWVVQVVGG